MPAIETRPESEADALALFNLHALVFGQEAEARLVDKLRSDREIRNGFSWIASFDGRVAGHVLFSELKISEGQVPVKAVALAPVAVLPEFQRQGVASSLIETALAKLRELGYQLVIVLGDPSYYRRFGFSIELGRWIECPYSGPHLMALELDPNILQRAGKIRAVYTSAFSLLD